MTRGRTNPIELRDGLRGGSGDKDVRSYLQHLGFPLRGDIQASYASYARPNGFTKLSDSTLSWSGTSDPVVTLAPDGGSFTYYAAGQLVTVASSLAINAGTSSGLTYVYLDSSGSLQASQYLTGDILALYTIVAAVHFSVDDGVVVHFEDLRREVAYAYRPTLQGTRARFGGGMVFSVPNINGTGANDSDGYVAIGDGFFWDGEVAKAVAGYSVAPASVPVFWRATNGWKKQAASDLHVVLTTGLISWNEWNGTAWSATQVPSGSYVLMHYFATADPDEPVICVMGLKAYTSAPTYSDCAWEIDSILLNNMPSLAVVYMPIATVTWECDSSFTNSVKARLVNGGGVDYWDWRTFENVGASLINTTRGGVITNGDYTASAGSVLVGRTYGAGDLEELTIGSGLALTGSQLDANPTWGSITGTLSDQTDLQAQLNNKVDSSAGAFDSQAPTSTVEATADDELVRYGEQGAQDNWSMWSHFLSASPAANGLNSNTSGSGAGTGSNWDRVNGYGVWGVAELRTGTTSTGRASITGFHDSFRPDDATWSLTLETHLCVHTLSTASDEFKFYWGLQDNTTASSEPNDGSYFRYDRSTDGDFWVCVTRRGGVETKTVTPTAPATSSYQTLRIEQNTSNTQVVFQLDGKTVATHTTNLPSGRVGVAWKIYKTAGTTSRVVCIDWYRIRGVA